MFDFIKGFISNTLNSFRTRGFVSVLVFDGGAVCAGVAVFALANWRYPPHAFASGFGFGITTMGTLGLLTSFYENNCDLTAALHYFTHEGGLLLTGLMIYFSSCHSRHEGRYPSVAQIGLAISAVGVICVLFTFREMYVLYNDNTIQVVCDLRKAYATESSKQRIRRRRSSVRSIGKERTLSDSMKHKDSSSAERKRSEIPQETDSCSSEQSWGNPGENIKKTEARTRKEFSPRRKPPRRESFPQDEYRPATVKYRPRRSSYTSVEDGKKNRGGVEHVGTSTSEDLNVSRAAGAVSSPKKDNSETYPEDDESQIAGKMVHTPKKSPEYESKEEHGAKKKVYPSKQETTKKRVKRLPVSELLAEKNRSSSNVTSEADDFKSLQQVFGVTPPRRISPEQTRKRKIDCVDVSPERTKTQSPAEEKGGKCSELEKLSKETNESKTDKEQVGRQPEEKLSEKEIERGSQRSFDTSETLGFDHLEIKQEINTAVAELGTILKSIMSTSQEYSLDIPRDVCEIGSNAEVPEDNSNASQTPELTVVRKSYSPEERFTALPRFHTSESRRLFPISIEEYKLKGPTEEVIKVILEGSSEDSSSESDCTMGAFESTSRTISGSFSVPYIESFDQENRSSEEIKAFVLGSSSETPILNPEDMHQEQSQNVIEEILKNSMTSADKLDPTEDAKEHSYAAERSIPEFLQGTDESQSKDYVVRTGESQVVEESFLHYSDPLPVTVSVLHISEPQPEEETVLHQDERQTVEESAWYRGKSQQVGEGILCLSEPQPEEPFMHRNEPQPVEESVLHRGEPQHLGESVLHRGGHQLLDQSILLHRESQPEDESFLPHGKHQPIHEIISHRGDSQPADESISPSDEPQPVDESMSDRSEPQPVDESMSDRSEPQPVDESILQRDDPQLIDESVLHRGELYPAEECALHQSEQESRSEVEEENVLPRGEP